jgi:hypothetical protein
MTDQATTNLQCPSCGAALRIEHHFVKMVVCPYCRTVSMLNVNGLSAAGTSTPLIDYGSLLSTGASGTANGVGFSVAGRTRYGYGDGFWDEWHLVLRGAEDERVWLQEDDGAFTAFKPLLEPSLPQFANVNPGATVTVGKLPVFVTEKGTAAIQGCEGLLPRIVAAEEQVRYWDGIVVGTGRIISVEYGLQEASAFEGKPFPVEWLQIVAAHKGSN